MVTSEEMSEIVGGNVKEKLSSEPESLTDICGQSERSGIPSDENYYCLYSTQVGKIIL